MRRSGEARTLAPGDELTDDATGDRYRVHAMIGEGGMGRVFKAESLGSGAIVAVKCNQPIDPTNEALIERSRREGEFLKELRRHPHIVPVLATGMRGDGVFWMVMPLLDGASVGSLLSVLGRIPLPWTLRIAQAICSALAEAHRYAIHRDIKPENVFVTRDGGIFVLDFGAGKFYAVGRLTTTGTTLGTVQYSSPEQLTDPDNLDERSDLFSIGVMMFEMLTGTHPFDLDGPLRGNRIIIGNRIIREPPRALSPLAPGVPSYMAQVIGKLLEKDRNQRSRNAAEAGRVIGAALGELHSKLGEPPPIERIFDAYDAALRAQELATGDTEKVTPAELKRSGPRPVLGTVPLAAFVPPQRQAPPVLPAPPPSAVADADRAERLATTTPLRTAELAGADEDQLYIQRKLDAIERLHVDDAPQTREVLLVVLRDPEESHVIRAGAAVALAVVGDETCLEALQASAMSDTNPIVRRMCEESALELALRLGIAVEPLPFLQGEERSAAAEPARSPEPATSEPEPARPPIPPPETLSPWAQPPALPDTRQPQDMSEAIPRRSILLWVAAFFVSFAVVLALGYFVFW